MNAEEALKRVNDNTIGVMPTLGVTFSCHYEPVAEVAEALDRLHKQTGLDIPIHVDAASGGFVAPFIEPDLIWDFRIPRVRSINASGHKFGMAPLGISWVIKIGADPGYSLFDLSDRLRTRGWQAAANNMLPNIAHVVVMRLLIRHGFSRDMADLLLADLKREIAHLQKHKPTVPLTAGQATSFTHDALPLEKLPQPARENVSCNL